MEKQSSETERADRSMFVQELLLSTLAERLRLDDHDSLTLSSSASTSSESDSDTQSVGNDTTASEGTSTGSGGGGSGGGTSGGGSGASNVSVDPSGGASVNVGVAERVVNAATPPPASIPVSNAVGRNTAPRSNAKPTAHRNMVKPHREGTKNSEKEPPPSAQLARH